MVPTVAKERNPVSLFHIARKVYIYVFHGHDDSEVSHLHTT